MLAERRMLMVKFKLPAHHSQLLTQERLLPSQTRPTTAFQQEHLDADASQTPVGPETPSVDSPQSLLISLPLSHAASHASLAQNLISNASNDAGAQSYLDPSPPEVAPASEVASLLTAPQDKSTATAGASVNEATQDTEQSNAVWTSGQIFSKFPESECIRVAKPRPAGENDLQPQAEIEPQPTLQKRVSISIHELLLPASEEPFARSMPNQMMVTNRDTISQAEAAHVLSAPQVPIPSDTVGASSLSYVPTAGSPSPYLDVNMQEPVPEAVTTADATEIPPRTPQTAHVKLKLSPASMAKFAERHADRTRSALDYGRDRNPRRTATKAFAEPKTPEKAVPKAKSQRENVKPREPIPNTKPSKRGLPSIDEPAAAKRHKINGTSRVTRASPDPTQPSVLSPDPAAARSFELDSVTGQPRPVRDVEGDSIYVQHMMTILEAQSTSKINDTAKEQSVTMKALLARATYARDDEALFLTASEAMDRLAPGEFWNNVMITADQQPLPLQTIEQFLREFYEEDALVWIQDCSAKSGKQAPSIRQVPIKAVRERFAGGKLHSKPWNLLELATHHEDGLRPGFLNNEDCRLLTKLKIPDAADHTRRKTYPVGFKEVEKWALLAQAGALTLPHQDSHGYSTYITVNVGLVGFGWLSSPTPARRADWNKNPQRSIEGPWRYVVLKPGQTVYFPAGTVHFVFRLPSAGNTLAFGGHVLRCSNIVHWVRCLLEEAQSASVTNEDLTDSATGYLERVERFVRQARKTGETERWGGEKSITEFLLLKAEFMNGKKQR